MQRTNKQLAFIYLYSQRDEWMVGMMDVQGCRGAEGWTDGQREEQSKKELSFIGLYWIPVCDTKYK